MNTSDVQTLASGLGFQWPSPAYLLGMLLFSLIGWGVYRYGKRMERPRTKWLGVALMLYSYAVPQTWLLYLVGVALCAAVYWWPEA